MNAVCTRHGRGFSLIEVLVAVLVVSSGLLGFAATQAAAISNTATARYQALAAIEVSSVAAMMTANPGYWSSGSVPATTCLNVTAGVVYINQYPTVVTCPASASSGSGALATATANCASVACTPTQMAAYQLDNWTAGLVATGQFAQPNASIVCGTSVPVSCLVTINWYEKTVASGLGGASFGVGAVGTPTYSEVVEP